MLSRPLSPQYAARCLAAIKSFAQSGDPITALCPYYAPEASCELCGREAIYRCFPIKNENTDRTLILGVECIQAYRVLTRKLRRGKEHFRDPGTLASILKRFLRCGEVSEEEALDLAGAGKVAIPRKLLSLQANPRLRA